jgi:hypothetical protein
MSPRSNDSFSTNVTTGGSPARLSAPSLGNNIARSPTCTFLGVQWRAVVYGYISVGRITRESWRWLAWRMLTLRIYYTQFQRIPTVRTSRRILSGFCAEAAVLIAVFPYLDFLIARQETRELSQPTGGPSLMDMGSVKRLSAILCVMCLASAVILAIKTPDEKE